MDFHEYFFVFSAFRFIGYIFFRYETSYFTEAHDLMINYNLLQARLDQ